MRKIVYGDEREEALEDLEDTKIYDAGSDFSNLDLWRSYTVKDPVLVFLQAEGYNTDTYQKISDIRDDTDREIIILCDHEDNLPQYLKKGFEVVQSGDAETNDFGSKIQALKVESPSREQLERLKTLPLDYLLTRLSRLDNKQFPAAQKAVDYCNQRLYAANSDYLYEYLARNINIYSSSIFTRDQREIEYENLIEEISEISDKSKQEIERNLPVLVTKYRDDLNLNETQESLLGEIRGVSG